MRAPAAPAGTLGVLLVSAGGFQGLGLIKSLRQSARVRVVVADCHAENVARYFADEFHRVPPVADREGFLHALSGVCEGAGIRLMLPCTDHELSLLAESREVFAGRGVRVGVSDPALLALLRHRGELHAALARDAFPLASRLDPRAPDPPFPMLGKPVRGWGGRGQWLVRNPEELAAVPPEALAVTHVWYPFFEAFEEFSVDFSIDFDGLPSSFGVRRRVRTAAGFAVISDCHDLSEVGEVMRRLAGWAVARGGCGLFNVQLLRKDGALLVSDVNPRPGTSAVHWCGTGPNPALHLCASADPGFLVARAPSPPRARGRMIRYLAELWLELEAADPSDEAGVQGIVFDLDDTLIDHKRWILLKLQQLSAARPDELPAHVELIHEAMQIVEEGHTETLFDRLAERLGLAAEAKQRLIDTYRGLMPASCPPYADVWPTLETLKRRGFRLAVLTDNPPASQKQKLDVSGLVGCFDAIVYARELGAEKPDRRGFDQVARRLALEPRRLAMVGDNPYRDVAGALAAGYGVAYQVRRPGTFFNFDPDLFGDVTARARYRVIEGVQPLLRHLQRAATRAV